MSCSSGNENPKHQHYGRHTEEIILIDEIRKFFAEKKLHDMAQKYVNLKKRKYNIAIEF